MMKALTYALISCALLNLAAPFATGPGFVLVRNALSPGGFILFSISLAAGLCHLKPLALIISVGTCIAAYPDTESLARLLIPIGTGILLGTALRETLPQPKEPRA